MSQKSIMVKVEKGHKFFENENPVIRFTIMKLTPGLPGLVFTMGKTTYYLLGKTAYKAWWENGKMRITE